MQQQTYIFCYDYGMGGLWGSISAPSREAVQAMYPELTLFDERPSWLKLDNESHFEHERHSIEDAPWGVLNAVLEDREAGLSLPREAWPVFLAGKGDPVTGKGKWLFIRARSEFNLRSKYPQLAVVHGKRPWSLQGVRGGAISNEAVFIDVPPTGLLAEILEDCSDS